MTTAARPTFDPARGKDSSAPTLQLSSKDLPAHKKLKYRQPGQGGDVDGIDESILREQLLKAERQHVEKIRAQLLQGVDGSENILQLRKAGNLEDESKKIEYIEYLQSMENENRSDDGAGYEDEHEHGHESEKEDEDEGGEQSEENSSDQSDESESEDETEQLMRELEKIKKERERERKKRELEEEEEELSKRNDEYLTENPLLNEDMDFEVKRRWDDDVVFKNQARGVDLNPKKRFINDMLRSDFHKKFMSRYIQ
ncbi:Protein CWC15-like protein [Zancudomyces culisetae]|uniref:Protein CWC15-like protein n=1 Tax=Zancudomyces culisetae TaxID=1213189 RepID=A0A1R1PZM0_ZANCU|nr:Protein CWC15-like protein [Zancudomyces culisetae]|eukprot:OMH86411.1 Protein CWC15-like protein [Zancudomyces culisetae]